MAQLTPRSFVSTTKTIWQGNRNKIYLGRQHWGQCRRLSASVETVGLVAAGLISSVPLSISLDAVIDRAIGRVDKLANTSANGIDCYIAFPEGVTTENIGGCTVPVVVMIHQIFGLQAREVELCEELARQGYVAVAVDTFGKRSTTWIPRAIWLAYDKALKPDADYGVPQVHSVVQWIRAQEWGKLAKLGVVGFCYGGGSSLRYAVQHPENLQAVTVFYGRPVPSSKLKNIKCPLLGIYGTADSQFPKNIIDGFEEAMDKLKVASKISRYSNQPHAFVKDLDLINQGGPAQEAWREFVAFLNHNLKDKGE